MPTGLDEVELHLIDSIDEVFAFQRWLGERRERDVLAIDTETTGLKVQNDHVRLAQIGDTRHGWAMDWHRWGGIVEEVVKKYTGRFVGHNMTFDGSFLAKDGVPLPRERTDDTRHMCHLKDPTYSTALKPNASRYVDPRAGNAQKDLDEALGKKGGWTWATIPVTFEPYWTYAALDTVITAMLEAQLAPEIHSLYPKAYEIENNVQWITRDMEIRGTMVDVKYAAAQHDKFIAYCDEVAAWCVSTYGIKPGSNAAVIKVLQDEGFDFDKKTKGGAIALDAETLERIDHPLARAVLTRRRLEKRASTYLRHYMTEADGDGLIHPSINTIGARTSRMSMSDPNFQNLPRSSDDPADKVIRNCVIARPGFTLLFCDFSQIEMRILAHLSEDPGMIAAFHAPEDFFVLLARQAYGDPTIDKKHPLRQRIKNYGYASIYGAGAGKLAVTAGISVAEAQHTDALFNSAFPGKARYVNENFRTAMQNKQATGTAFVNCPLTNRRHPADPGREYALVNFTIQGMAAALFKMKLIELDAAGLGDYMIFPVHDEIILDVPNAFVPAAVEVLQSIMNDRDLLRVPIEAEVSYGWRWGLKRGWDMDRWLSEVDRRGEEE